MFSWYKWVAFKNGISPREFRKSRLSDWFTIMEIDNAISERGFRQKQVNKLMANIKRR